MLSLILSHSLCDIVEEGNCPSQPQCPRNYLVLYPKSVIATEFTLHSCLMFFFFNPQRKERKGNEESAESQLQITAWNGKAVGFRSEAVGRPQAAERTPGHISELEPVALQDRRCIWPLKANIRRINPQQDGCSEKCNHSK